MDIFFLSTLVMAIIVWHDAVPKWKDDKRCFWLSILFLTAGYSILSMESFGIDVPSPAGPLVAVLKNNLHFLS